MAAKIKPSAVKCPTCKSKCINHKTFVSTRVADYENNRFVRYYRCGPIQGGLKHEEHEWPVNDIRPGQMMIYEELGDENCGVDNGTPIVVSS